MAKKKDTAPENTLQGDGATPDAATGTQQGAAAGDNSQDNATATSQGGADKTPTPDAGTDTGNAALKKIGKEALKRNSSMPAVFVTSDGTVFGTKNDAENHAKTLDDKGVTEVTK